MKAYSGPEELEAHIAPAALIAADGTNTADVVPGDQTSIESIDLTATQGGTQLGLFERSGFRIQTVTLGADGSPLAGGQPAAGRLDDLLLPLLGDFTIESSLTEPSAISLLADEVKPSESVLAAIVSAVGEDRSAALVGLSSEEFERSGGAAFLTRL
jgi:hypothetical protein